MRISLKQSLVSLSFAAALVLSGCGGSSTPANPTSENPGGGTPNDENPGSQTPTEQNSYKGDRSLSGSIESFGNGLEVLGAENPDEVVKLYVLDDNGDMKDTNITCSIKDNTYECPNIAGNKEYIVRYMKKVGDGKVLEMKSNITVTDKDMTDVKVDRVSSLIVDTIAKAVEEALVGVKLTEENVKDLITNVKDAIASSFVALVENGLVEIPSQNDMVVTLEEDETFEKFTGVVKDNDKLSSASDVILTDEGVTKTLQANKNLTKADKYYATLTNKELVKEIFEQTSDDGGVPDWVVNFLGDNYDTKAYTIGQFQDKLSFESEALEDGSWNPDEWFSQELERIGIDNAAQQELVESILTIVNTQISSGAVLNTMKEKLAEFYALKSKADKTPEDIEKLADFPPVITYLFSQEFAATMTEETQFENMGQAIVYIMFTEQLVVKEVQKNVFETYLKNNNKPLFEEKLERLHIVEIDPFFIFQDLGFAVGGNYDTLSMDWFEARTETYWNENGQKEFFVFQTSIEKPGWMMSENPDVNITKVTNATLTYPTKNGMKIVNLDPFTEDERADSIRLSYDPWMECHGGGECEPDTSKMNITDHVSGNYMVNVTYDGESISKTKELFVLSGASNFAPEFISPLAHPQWPSELHSLDWSNQENWTQEQIAIQQEFQTKQDKFMEETDNKGYTSFATNFDMDNDGTNDAIKDIVFKWSADDLTKKIEDMVLPENIIPAYQVGINLHERKDTNGDGTIDQNDCNGDEGWRECNTEIYNTWWNNRPIKGTSFKLPMPLKENAENSEYNINVNLVFIDKNSGRDVGRGGNTYASFKVGTVGVLNGDETITFTGNVADEKGTIVASDTKVALIKETCTFDAETFVHNCTQTTMEVTTLATNGDYNLTVTVGEVQDAMDRKSHFNLLAFEDRDGDDSWDSWKHNVDNAENQNSEMAWWLENKHFWFDNFGEFRINIEEHGAVGNNFNHKSIRVKSGEDVEISDLDFKVFNWNF